MDEGLLERLRKSATRFSDVRLIVLFGSVARGEALSWSDADIGVAGAEFWTGLEVGAELESVLGRESHVVELDRASDWLRYEVARGGIVLREREPWAWARFQAEAAVRWFDIAPIVALCAEGARKLLAGGRGRG